ncbi:MAG TPA: hypothetical protein VJT78_07565 [Candidatus Dormibacteraeota bacterium]|nr:hypothetical protein [Candidatus Dormibacteraeota bacterium]
MGRFRQFLIAAIGVVSLVGAGAVGASAHSPKEIVEFTSMTPVSGGAVGTVNSRGLTGGGLPWVIRSGRGEVDAAGEVEVRVRGLVIPVAPLNGTNPVPFFRATVSCLTGDGVVNVSTGLFPANSEGDARIEGQVTLPSTCNDPIVFVVSPGGAWFAESNARD